jgi:hypothetical protein
MIRRRHRGVPCYEYFRRLEEVRSRLRSRRRRRLSAAAINTGAAALVAVSALAAPTVTGLLLSRSGRPAAPLSLSVSLVDDVRGQVTGWVKAVAPESGIVRVSSGAFGLRSLALVVTPETIIIVGDKEGGRLRRHPGRRTRRSRLRRLPGWPAGKAS